MKKALVIVLLSCMALLGIGCGSSAENTSPSGPPATEIEGPAFVLFFTDP